jgi:hypothetical protein
MLNQVKLVCLQISRITKKIFLNEIKLICLQISSNHNEKIIHLEKRKNCLFVGYISSNHNIKFTRFTKLKLPT